MPPIKLSQTSYTQRFKRFLEKEEVKAYTMAILSLFAISFFTLFAIKPTINTFFSLRRQIKDYEAFDKDLEKKINLLLKAQEQYQLYKDDLRLLDDALPSNPEFASMIKNVEKISTETNSLLSKLEIRELDFIDSSNKQGAKKEKNPVQKTDYLSYDLSVQVTGLYSENESFLKRLLNLRRIITFLNLKMDKADQEDNKNISTDINGRTYYLKK